MKRPLVVFISVLLLIILIAWWVVVINVDSNVTPLQIAPAVSSPTGLTDVPDSDTDPEASVLEASTGADSRVILAERLKVNPWATNLPQITERYSIYYSGKNEAPELEIVLESKNAAEFQAYQKEALDWLRSQGAPVDKLTITTTYRGQP